MVIWTEFFVDSKEINTNGTLSSTVNLDRINPIWAKKLQQASYAVISQGNWFGRKTYINRKHKPIGCVNCEGENMTNIRVPSAIRMVFKAAFKFINKCKKCEDLVTVMRTYSMGHFEDGSWLNGGYCNRTQPLREGDLRKDHEAWEIRRVQLEEMERAKREGNKRIELLDVTKAMMLRADAHPGRHWMVKDTNDCLHWCLPGPIDMWSELLLEILKKKS
ncbi:uncharacterized protein A4U43_C05F23680 [Asparagus officinalis]|uniref:Trichome birefringence-like C-terminal domain-containing protein n=1 Tax=Asparagus officinalis TaxID=4686 RepID=A0A5P1EY99_ASPOF|nr:protein ALTERED XYLOGLUCAN 4-like [Asparagus officinalis]ONK69509.1 uncharacterized protein A4U43_C05F23680 [Asparagus officinalis]